MNIRKPLLSSFGERLRYEMKRNLIQPSSLAEKIGVHRSAISSLYNRSSCPKPNARIFKAKDIYPEMDWDYIAKGYSEQTDDTRNADANDYFYEAIHNIKHFMVEHGLTQITCLNITIKHEAL